MGAKLVLIRGLPGAGKSTLAEILALQGFVHYEADKYFTDDNGMYRFDSKLLPAAHNWCQSMTRGSLLEGKKVVVANTFTTSKELMPYFQIARDAGIVPNVVTCHGSFQSIHNVPKNVIDNMRARFQANINCLFN